MEASNHVRSRHATAWALLSVSVLVLAGCVKDPVTGKRELVLVSEAQEIQMGRSASADVDASMGIVDNPALNDYVSRLGLSMATVSERPQLPWQFRVVDSPVVNAFALPGGFIYLTRGILAYINDEAALMGIMGHEIGHVTARHSVEQITKQQLAGLGLGMGMIFLPEVRPFGDVLGSGVGILFLKFSRDAERESDRLGVRYSLGQGYDPTTMAEFFDVLGRLGDSAREIPSWASTHPAPEERHAEILRLIAAQAPNRDGLRVGEEVYKQQIEGLIFGENPREGYTEGSRFLHPDLKFQLDFPDQWKVMNTKQVVYSASPDGGAAIQLTGAPVSAGTRPEDHAMVFFRKNQLEYGTGERLNTGPFPAYRAPFRVQTQAGTLVGDAGFVVDGEMAYEIVGLTRPDGYRRAQPIFRATISSFDRLRDENALEIQPVRVHLYPVPTTMALQQVLESAGMDSERFDEIALMNNISLSSTVPAGKLIKILHRGSSP